MKAKELLKPRFEVIASFPNSYYKVGNILQGDLIFCDPEGDKYSDYPHLFRKLNWWEKRSIEDMPKKLICKAIPDDDSVQEIYEWDMRLLIGWLDENKFKCCSLKAFNPKFGYFPVD